jgi:hypothetical protein
MNPNISRALFALSVTAWVLTALGLLLDVGLRYDNVSDALLSYYPKYALAMRGFHILEDMKYPAPNGPNQTIKVGVLSIEDPSWPIMLSFLQTETAFLKSERNDTAPLLAPASNPASVPAASTPTAQQLPPVNFARIKTILSVKVDAFRVGNQSVVPPYSLTVLWPVLPTAVPRKMYEFLSFEEFRLDLHQVMVQRLETMSLWLALIAFLVGSAAEGLRRFSGCDVQP